jgi:hypothetical protein
MSWKMQGRIIGGNKRKTQRSIVRCFTYKMQQFMFRGKRWELQRANDGGAHGLYQRIKYVAKMHIPTKINGCLLVYRSEGNLNGTSHIITDHNYIITDTFINLDYVSNQSNT